VRIDFTDWAGTAPALESAAGRGVILGAVARAGAGGPGAATTGASSRRQSPLDLAARADQPVCLEFVQIRHAPQECELTSPSRQHLGWCVDPAGRGSPLPQSALRHRDPTLPVGLPDRGASNVGRLLLGYGRQIQAHAGTDSFAIFPDQRLKRCVGLFDPLARLTDPVAFLRRLHYKAQFRHGRARALLARLGADLSVWLGWDVARSLAEDVLAARWRATPAARRTPALVALDLARHMYDVTLRLPDPDPLQQPGVVLLDRLEGWCPAGRQPDFFTLLDAWFPQIQFFVTLSAPARRRFPTRLLAQSLPIPEPRAGRQPVPSARLPRHTILLVDVDGTLPNLALMKLSRHWKACKVGKVVLARGVQALPDAETVLASSVFSTAGSAGRVERLRRRYGAALQVGGSGVDLQLRLDPEIEVARAGLLAVPGTGGSRPGLSHARLSAALPLLRGARQGRRAAPGERPRHAFAGAAKADPPRRQPAGASRGAGSAGNKWRPGSWR
jgi:hypothetical protein